MQYCCCELKRAGLATTGMEEQMMYLTNYVSKVVAKYVVASATSKHPRVCTFT